MCGSVGVWECVGVYVCVGVPNHLLHAAKRDGLALPHGMNEWERLKGGAEGGEDGGAGNDVVRSFHTA